jgi:hypothetical protein
MKNLKLYEQYIMEAEIASTGGISAGAKAGRPNMKGSPSQQKNEIEVVLYSDIEQKHPEKRGWINLKEWDKAINDPRSIDPYIIIEGKIYSNENSAKLLSGGERLVWGVKISDGRGTFFTDKGKEKYCRNLNSFLINRYLQKNQSGIWIIKVSSGGQADNSSADTPDKFA